MPRSRLSILGDDNGSTYLPEKHFGMFPLFVSTDVSLVREDELSGGRAGLEMEML